jgi:hypothetical protein
LLGEALPFYQILELIAEIARVQYSFDDVFEFGVDEEWWGRRTFPIWIRVGECRLEEGNVENRVNSHITREFHFEGNIVDFGDDGIWADLLIVELLGRAIGGHVSCGNKNVLSNTKLGVLTSPVRILLGIFSGSKKYLMSTSTD